MYPPGPAWLQYWVDAKTALPSVSGVGMTTHRWSISIHSLDVTDDGDHSE